MNWLKTNIFILSFFMTILSLQAQCLQKVRVLEYQGEKPKTPLARVEVIVGNAGSVITDEQGRCTLKFRTLKPGDKVTVRRIGLPGYEVFNPEALEQWHISRDGSEYVIVLCEQKRMKDLRDQYHAAANKSLRNDLEFKQQVIKSSLNKGGLSQQDYEKKLEEFRLKYEEDLENIDNYIDRLVRTDLSEIDEAEKEVMDLLMSGDINGAIAAYESVDLIASYQTGIQSLNTIEKSIGTIQEKVSEISSSREKIYESLMRQVALLRMQGGDENLEKSIQLLHDVAYSDTSNYVAMTDYAYYCIKNQRYDEAIDALWYCYNAPDTSYQFRAYILRCEAANNKGDWKRSAPILTDLYERMTEMSRKRQSTTLFLEERAYALTLLVGANTSLRDTAAALYYEQDMIDLNRRYYEQKGDNDSKRRYVDALYEAYYCESALEIADSNAAMKKLLTDAIKLQEELYAEDPTAQTAMLAFLHSKLATFYMDYGDSDDYTEDIPKLEHEYSKAEELYEEAFQKHPRSYVTFLSQNYLNHAILYIQGIIDNNAQAEFLLEKAKFYIDEETRLMQRPNRVRIAAYNRLAASHYLNKKEYKKSESHVDAAIDMYRVLVEELSSGYNAQLNECLRVKEKLKTLTTR